MDGYSRKINEMKKIEAIIQPFKLEEVKEALKAVGIDGMDRSVVAGGVGATHGEFMQVRLTNEDGAGSLEAARDFCIDIGNPIVEYGACRRGPNARGIDIVFEGDGNAV